MRQLLLPLGPDQPSRRSSAKQHLCVYCGATASTRDHAPPKAILEEPYPPNLRTVPSCRSCNAGWSLDEEYLAVVLAQVGHVPHLAAKVEEGGKIDRALAASPGLDETIVKALRVTDDGRVWFQPDVARIRRITTKVAFGLHALRYGRGSGLDRFETTWIGGPGDEPPFNLVTAQWKWPGIRRKRWRVVQRGAFSFLFAEGWLAGDPPLFCLLDFHRTIFAAVSCPAPVGRRVNQRLPAKPW